MNQALQIPTGSPGIFTAASRWAGLGNNWPAPPARSAFLYNPAVSVPEPHGIALNMYFAPPAKPAIFRNLKALAEAAHYHPTRQPKGIAFSEYDTFAEAKYDMYLLKFMYPKLEMGICRLEDGTGPYRLFMGHEFCGMTPDGYRTLSHTHYTAASIPAPDGYVIRRMDEMWRALPSVMDIVSKNMITHVGQLDGKVIRESLAIFFNRDDRARLGRCAAEHQRTFNFKNSDTARLGAELLYGNVGIPTRVFMQEFTDTDRTTYDAIMISLFGNSFERNDMTKVIMPTSALLMAGMKPITVSGILFAWTDDYVAHHHVPIRLELVDRNAVNAMIINRRRDLTVKRGSFDVEIPIDWMRVEMPIRKSSKTLPSAQYPAMNV